ncbi:MAG: hypothetical protein FWE03_04305 [Firmicutes bacterium]|nr:hypothetical protein [Bacillota bacterium]
MKKKLVCIGIVIVMMFGVAGLSGCGYTYQDGDFLLTVTANKTEMRVGETIEFTIRFENNTGRNLRVIFSSMGNFPNSHLINPSVFFDVFVKGENLEIFGLDNIIYATIYSGVVFYVSWTAEQVGRFYAQAYVNFSVLRNQTWFGRNNTNGAARIEIYSEKISFVVHE